MSYATIAEIRTASGFNDDTKLSDATITAYLADADAVINAAIADVYSLPVSATSELLNTIARHITVALLYANEYGEESQGSDKGWKNRMEWATDRLTDIQKLKLKLYDSSGNELSRSTLLQPVFRPTADTSEEGEDDEPRLTKTQQF